MCTNIQSTPGLYCEHALAVGGRYIVAIGPLFRFPLQLSCSWSRPKCLVLTLLELVDLPSVSRCWR